MNTNSIETLGGTVNVTIHKNYFKEDDSTYAKVQRTTAGMNNVIAQVLTKTNLFDRASLVAVTMLFKDAVLELLTQGIAVNLFELGTLYPSAQGNISSSNPSVTDIPTLTLGFTPSSESLSAVSKADISMAQLEETCPQISLIENLATHSSDGTLSRGKPVRITGRRLKIAGNEEETGLYFAPIDSESQTYSRDKSTWVKVAPETFFKNTGTYLEFILNETMTLGEYTLILKTAAGRGSSVNKTVRTMVYEKNVNVE